MMLRATSDKNELNDVDWSNFFINIVMFDFPAYLISAVNLRLQGQSWETALIGPLPVFLMALIDLGKKYLKGN